jgi:uncharacterized cupredoxin-like copper-binding protein
MRPLRLAALGTIALVVVGCSGGGSSPAPSAAASASAAPAAAAAPSAAPNGAATRLEVTLTDALRIEPAAMTVPAGVPVTFVVTNNGAVEHEFVLGDEAAQAEHEMQMGGPMGMDEDEEMALSVAPGATKELTVTFPAAASLVAGCHVAGHYAGGMKATVEVE